MSELKKLVEQLTPTVEFYLKREIEAPANHQEFAREAQEKLDHWHELESALAAQPQVSQEQVRHSYELALAADHKKHPSLFQFMADHLNVLLSAPATPAPTPYQETLDRVAAKIAEPAPVLSRSMEKRLKAQKAPIMVSHGPVQEQKEGAK